ncbi:MAG: extracellular solute-binding protein [Coleofasciculus sp. G3-WIS-01]|uniref:extracellular solute-binding protein n=1 Tax=Coleofasciculus sp. G3-WIS-01 TaxID=3069528 RepID=UPI0032FD5C7C
MKARQLVKRLGQFSRRLNSRSIWAFVAVVQVLLLLLIYLTWPPTHLTLFVSADEDTAWQSLITDFHNQYPNIRINLRTKTNLAGDITYRLKDDFVRDCQTGNSLYDLVYTDIIWMPEFAAKGCLVDLYKWTARDTLVNEGFLPSTIDAGEYQGKLYRMPLRSDIGLLYYRKNLLGNTQPPETLQQLKQLSQTWKNQGNYQGVYLWQGWRYEGLVATFVEVLESYGGFWIKPDSLEVGLDQPEAEQAVQFLLNTIRENISSPEVILYSEQESLDRFNQDPNTLFIRQWPYAWNQLADPSNVGVQVLNLSFDTDKNTWVPSGCNGSWGLGISKNSQHPDQAWKALQYFTSQAAQKKLILEQGYLPSREALYDDPEIKAKYPYLPSLKEAVKNSILRPPIPQYDQASFILQKYLSKLITRTALAQRVDNNEITQLMQESADETRQLLNLEMLTIN